MSEFNPSHLPPDDHQAWQAMMPFYLAYTLPDSQAQALSAHLITCRRCQDALEEWRMIANATHQLSSERAQQLPRMSAALRQQIDHEGRQRAAQRPPNPPTLTVMPRHNTHSGYSASPVRPPSPAESTQTRLTPMNSRPPMPAGRHGRPAQRRSASQASVWLMRSAAVLVLVFTAGLVVALTRDRLLTLHLNATETIQVAGNITATLTPVPSLAFGTDDHIQEAETTLLTTDESLDPTPWNTVMPIQQSATPTFTITPQPTLETVIDQAATQRIQITPVITQSESAAGTSVIVPTVTQSITRPTEGGSIRELTSPDAASIVQPVVQRFSVIPNTVQPGQTVTVHWQTTGADQIEIAMDTAQSGIYQVVHTTDVAVNSVSFALPHDIRDQVSFELRLIQLADTGEATPAIDATSATVLLTAPPAVTEQVRIAVQCPYIYLIYGSRCPDATGTQFSATVQQFEQGWIIRRNDLAEGLVLWNNGAITTGVTLDQAPPTGTPPTGLYPPANEIAAFYQSALGWALTPAQQVQITASPVNPETSASGGRWFALRIVTPENGRVLLALQLNWLPAGQAGSTGNSSGQNGNFQQWYSVN